MLILTRRPREAVMIGSTIEVRVLDIRGNQVQIGFTAPDDLAINREEVYHRMWLEQQALLAGKTPDQLQREGITPPWAALHIKRRRDRRQSDTVDGNR